MRTGRSFVDITATSTNWNDLNQGAWERTAKLAAGANTYRHAAAPVKTVVCYRVRGAQRWRIRVLEYPEDSQVTAWKRD